MVFTKIESTEPDFLISNLHFASRLREIPIVLYGLPKLEIILASDNQINTIDVQGLIDTPQLGTLDLQNNDLMQIPPELGKCTQLRLVSRTLHLKLTTFCEFQPS